jgi:hypothetical protein
MAPRNDRAHTHQCIHCRTPVECHGTLERNHDGWPEVVCDNFHKSSKLFLCESCDHAFKQPDCHDCGGPSAVVFEDCDDASGYRGEEGLCLECLAKREARA